ncbi:MAG: tRNA (adenosine(37)-N6)-threonylcarbamoyltransferase complex dimerization subunit type 1 TsaB [Ramlibacter sp.]
MNLLAFDTSTEVFSVAIQRGHELLEQAGAGGAQASATLIPTIQGLLARAGLALSDLDAIVIGRGPGSFTGLRAACSVAQGLAFGAGLPVLAVATLLAVAEDAHWRAGVTQVVAVLDARMDEVYWTHYERDGGRWRRQGGFALGRVESVVIPPLWALAGNAFSAHGGRWRDAVRIEALPTAAALLRLAPALLADGHGGPAGAALPLYIRDKVAQTTEERAALRRGAAART